MELPLMPFEEETIEKFCREVGIKKVKAYVRNCDTDEVRFYQYDSGKYKIPKGWTNIEAGSFEKSMYPNLLSSDNFMKLLNCHWEVFGNFGNYRVVFKEPLSVNYLITRTNAVQACKAMGGGEMLDIYLDAIHKIKFDYKERIYD